VYQKLNPREVIQMNDVVVGCRGVTDSSATKLRPS